VIFDTDILIWCFRGNRSALETIGAERERALSIVSFMELVQGARSLGEVREIRRFLRDNTFRSGLQVADALIAATARETGEILATGNIRHFRPIAGLRLKTFRPSAR